MEVEEGLPSFSAERLRAKLRGRAVTQRRLDYNAPLLSVRRLAEAGGDVSSKVWKLSAELSKEPLRVPGAVPFHWEHSPGRPKQRASPPAPASPSPPCTPSPPLVRRASPASPTNTPTPPAPPPLPPPLPLLVSRPSTAFLPPPPSIPPPPPPPPPPPLIRNRPPPPPPPLPRQSGLFPTPPPLPPLTHLLFLPARPSGRPFTSITSLDPSLRQNAAIPDREQLPDHERIKGFRLVDPTEGFLRVLRARRQKAEPEEFREETDGGDTAEEASGAAVVAKEMVVDKAKITELSTKHESQCDGPKPTLKDSDCVVGFMVQRFLADHPDPADAALERQPSFAEEVSSDAVNVLPSVDSNGDAELQGKDNAHGNSYSIISLQGCAPHIVSSISTKEAPQKGESTVAVCSTAISEQGHSQQSRKGNKHLNRRSSIAILDSCRVESLRMIKNAVSQLCRKAAAASLRTFAKAKRKVTPSKSLEVVVHQNGQNLNEGGSDEEEAVVREVKAILQERHSLKTEKPSVSSILPQPGSPPKADLQNVSYAITLRVSSPPTHCSSWQEGSPNLSVEQADVVRFIRPRHVHAKSLGADDPNEFFDASSRFGSQSSTPGRTTPSHEGRTRVMLSKEWGSEEFLDATSTPFETPRASVSDNKSVVSESFCPSPASKGGSSSKPSKLSKRVGKALWVDTREVNAERPETSTNGFKGFLSGELNIGAHKKENCSRKFLSGEQGASTNSFTFESIRQHRAEYRNGSFSRHSKQLSLDASMNCKSSLVSVSPVFPAKCQKNRLMGLLNHESGSSADVGWPLGISGYHPESLLKSSKGQEEQRHASRCMLGVDVPSPPLPPSPAGGSWLRKALSSNSLNNNPSRLAGLHIKMAIPAKKPEISPTAQAPGKRWEDMVKGSHMQPGHLRFSEELYNHPPPNSNSTNKHFVS